MGTLLRNCMSKNQNARRNFLRQSMAGIGVVPLLPDWGQLENTEPNVQMNNSGAKPGGFLAEKHQNLFNGDTCVYFYNPELWQPEDYSMETIRNSRTGKMNAAPTAEGGPFSVKAIHNFVKTLANNGIDTFLINANASRAWYPSKNIPSIMDGYKRGNRDFFRGHAICTGATEPEAVEVFLDNFVSFMDRYQDLIDAGVDWLAETSKACRQHKIAPWVSIRMNDMHGSRNFAGSFFNLPLLNQSEMRLSRSSYGSLDANYRQGLNYEKAEVRAQMMAQIREVVEDYDFEGLELDWWRQPLCCEPNATPATVEIISDWIRAIRKLTEKRAKEMGRPYALGMRIPGQLKLLKSIGLDIVTLCREGTLDFVSPSGFYRTTWDMPHDEMKKELGDLVNIYGVIELGTNSMATLDPELGTTQPMRHLPASPETMRANAACKLALGAKGIEWFNFYCTDQPRIPGVRADYSAMRDLSELSQLRGKPKHYAFATGGRSLNLMPFELPAQLPAVIESNNHRAFKLPMCAEPDAKNLQLIVQLVIKNIEKDPVVAVSFNGSWPQTRNERSAKLLFPCGSLSEHVKEHTGLNYLIRPQGIKEGWNEIVVENGSKFPLNIVSVELAIKPTDV